MQQPYGRGDRHLAAPGAQAHGLLLPRAGDSYKTYRKLNAQ